MSTTAEAVQRIEQLIFADELPAAEALSKNDYDALLTDRDADEFAEPWTAAYDASKAPYQKIATEQELKGRIDKMREHVYKRVYKQTQVSDLASYVSDDIDLILRYLLAEMPNEWVNALWLSYKEGNIPSGTLRETPGELKDLVAA